MEYNYILVSSCAAWFLAQIIKTVTILVKEKKFVLERIYGPGGMPSGHSAMVCSAVVCVGRLYGTGGFEFAITLMFALVVMYDAMGVRREAGNHAKEINAIRRLLNYEGDDPEVMKKELKEILGHTPLQVVCGGIMGVVFAFIVPVDIGR